MSRAFPRRLLYTSLPSFFIWAVSLYLYLLAPGHEQKGKSTKNGKNFKDSEQETPKTYKFKKMSSFIDEGKTEDPMQDSCDEYDPRTNYRTHEPERTPMKTPNRNTGHFLDTSSLSRKDTPSSSVRKLNLDGLTNDVFSNSNGFFTCPFLSEPVPFSIIFITFQKEEEPNVKFAREREIAARFLMLFNSKNEEIFKLFDPMNSVIEVKGEAIHSVYETVQAMAQNFLEFIFEGPSPYDFYHNVVFDQIKGDDVTFVSQGYLKGYPYNAQVWVQFNVTRSAFPVIKYMFLSINMLFNN